MPRILNQVINWIGFVLLAFTMQKTTGAPTADTTTSTMTSTTTVPNPTLPPSWGYHDVVDEIPPFNWEKEYPTCKGTQQSPIHIWTNLALVDPTLGVVRFSGYDKTPDGQMWTVLNNGHTVQLSANYTKPPEIRSAGLPGTYILSQLHFHWGHTDSRGSEHSIDLKSYPLEMHMVHKIAPGSSNTAPGTAVVSVLFELAKGTQETNMHTERLAKLIADKQVEPLKPTNVLLTGFNLSGLLPPSVEYFRYNGSLTTPPCTQGVIWTVMRQALYVKSDQLTVFRSLQERPDEPNSLVDNGRPIQETGNRTVMLFGKNHGERTVHQLTLLMLAATFSCLIISLCYK